MARKRKPKSEPTITADQLPAHVAAIGVASDEDWDLFIEALLVACWPTVQGQRN